MKLLPETAGPRLIARRGAPSARALAGLDALLVMAPLTRQFNASLPQLARWRQLHAREAASAGTVRHSRLANPRQTLAVIGYCNAEASAFELLSLAGRMLRPCTEARVEKIAILDLRSDADSPKRLEALIAAAFAHGFEMPAERSKPSTRKALRQIEVFGATLPDLPRAKATATATNLVRHLTALPPNLLNAAAYRKVLGTLAKRHGLTLQWHTEAMLLKLGAGAFLAVSRGNPQRDAGIAKLSYRPTRASKAAPDITLVGKGIVFDTGGTNLKPHRGMLDMHTDMSGSAVALSTLIALAELKAPVAVDAWLAITENSIGPHAYRPQEIVRAANGVTIQVIHTDAEGRMVLADTLALAARTKPCVIVDFATLTGACVYALTDRMSGVFTNRDSLAPVLEQAGRASGERVWNFPLYQDYDTDIDSRVADVAQCAVDGKGDHILAARFLRKFVPEDIAWVHVDLASATRGGGLAHVPTEITGFGARFALDLILNQQLLRQARLP
ncbi:MAG: leucyl aminopeptidase family protein [Steroidobacteraceae bacterium]